LSAGHTVENFSGEEHMLRTIVPCFIRDEQGQDLVEYALITGLLSVLSVVLSNVVRGL
jgi:Flp pilus assembly pilin Flp